MNTTKAYVLNMQTPASPPHPVLTFRSERGAGLCVLTSTPGDILISGLQDAFARQDQMGPGMQTRWRGQAQVKSTCWAVEGASQPAVSGTHRELEHPRCPTPCPSALRPHHTEATLVTLMLQGT